MDPSARSVIEIGMKFLQRTVHRSPVYAALAFLLPLLSVPQSLTFGLHGVVDSNGINGQTRRGNNHGVL
eukprot:scaffold37471_cov33-Prasinocladus_malaysianus.AAC.1